MAQILFKNANLLDPEADALQGGMSVLVEDELVRDVVYSRESWIANMLSVSSIAHQPEEDREVLAERLRELVPPELQQQVTDLIRQVLILVRAILDRWIDRLEPGRGSEPDVEDIPIA